MNFYGACHTLVIKLVFLGHEMGYIHLLDYFPTSPTRPPLVHTPPLKFVRVLDYQRVTALMTVIR